METLIVMIIYIVLFAIVAYGLFWVCQKFGMPQPVLWLVGALLLIVILLFLAKQLGVSSPSLNLPR